jgi:hypothetical protein
VIADITWFEPYDPVTWRPELVESCIIRSRFVIIPKMAMPLWPGCTVAVLGLCMADLSVAQVSGTSALSVRDGGGCPCGGYPCVMFNPIRQVGKICS